MKNIAPLSPLILLRKILYVLLKALLPVCTKYTALGENRGGSIAQGKEAKCYICHKTLTKSCILSYKPSGSVLSVLLHFTLKDMLTECTPLKFNTFIQQINFFDKNVSIVLPIYNYSSIL